VIDNEPYIIIDGKLVPSSSPNLFHNNRAFCYGDGLFETIHAYGTELQLADEHFARLFQGMKTLKMEWDDNFSQKKITREIIHLLNRNKYFKGARVRLTVYRQPGGLFKPTNNSISYLIETNPLDIDFYSLNDKGLHINIFEEIKKTPTALSPYKTCSSLINVLAGQYVKESRMDDCLICNDSGHIIEGYHSNIFIVKNNILYTPPIESGCVAGIMRSEIVKISKTHDIKVNDKALLTEKVLLEADEIFLTNAIEGIRWVLAFNSRRYFNLMVKKLNERLNRAVFEKNI
jgi:branched-subunit amino acid aminotransferase/4-amino-4-deoxychorismate lyase